MTRAWFIGVTLVLTLTGATGAAADTKKARVRAHKTKAFQLFESGDYAGGIAEMEKAYALIPHPGFLLNVAVAYDRWPGHCAESLDTFERFFAECDACKLLANAKKQHAEVERTCRVEVTVRSTPEGARVAVDGAVRGKTPFTARLLPGRYAIVVDLGGHERAMETLEVERAKPQTLELTLAPKKAAPPPPRSPGRGECGERTGCPEPPFAASEPKTTTEIETAGPSAFTWVAFGVGAAGIVTGVAFTALAVKELDREEQARLTPLPKAEIEAFQRAARRDAIMAYAGYGIGVAGAATGVLLLLLTGDDEKELAAVPAIGAGTIGVAGRF